MNRERPILFSGPMIRAILERRKTQTRRIVGTDNRPMGKESYMRGFPTDPKNVRMCSSAYAKCDAPAGSGHVSYRVCCPYGPIGNRLWVRETWRPANTEHPRVRIEYRADGSSWGNAHTEDGPDQKLLPGKQRPFSKDRWRPSIHMPRWASRLTLEVTMVRVARLQDISGEDAQAEGVEHDGLVGYYCDEGDPNDPEDMGTHRCNWRFGFKFLWDSINADRYGWDSNPWVWVIKFQRV